MRAPFVQFFCSMFCCSYVTSPLCIEKKKIPYLFNFHFIYRPNSQISTMFSLTEGAASGQAEKSLQDFAANIKIRESLFSSDITRNHPKVVSGTSESPQGSSYPGVPNWMGRVEPFIQSYVSGVVWKYYCSSTHFGKKIVDLFLVHFLWD